MKKLLGFVVAVLVVSVSAAYANCGGCGAKKEGKGGCMADMAGKLDLTAQQKTKLAALEADCKAGKCTEAAHAKFQEGLKDVLTAEQLAKWDEMCKAKKASGGCPMKNSDDSHKH